MQSAAKKWLGLAVLGCAACCALPIAAFMGLSGAAGSTVTWLSGANVETALCLGALVTLTVGAIYYFIKRKRAARACDSQCNADASCCSGGSSMNSK